MKVNVDALILDIEGKPILEKDKPLTLKDLLIPILIMPTQKDEGISGQEKSRRFSLAVKLAGANGKPLDLEPEDIVKLKELVEERGTVLAVGRALELLKETNE